MVRRRARHPHYLVLLVAVTKLKGACKAECNSGCTGTILAFLPLSWRTRIIVLQSASKCVIMVIIRHLESPKSSLLQDRFCQFSGTRTKRPKLRVTAMTKRQLKARCYRLSYRLSTSLPTAWFLPHAGVRRLPPVRRESEKVCARRGRFHQVFFVLKKDTDFSRTH